MPEGGLHKQALWQRRDAELRIRCNGACLSEERAMPHR